VIHSDTQQLSANPVQLPPQSASAIITGRPLPNPAHEVFAQRLAAGYSFTAAYRDAGYQGTRDAVKSNSSRLAADPDVQNRIRELCRAAAASATFDVQARMHALLDIAESDASEICRIVVDPCPACWTAEAIAAAMDAAAAGAPMPDTEAPRADCRRGPHHRVELTPTEQLSGRARRLFKSVKQKPSGEIEVVLHDQLAASAQLAELAGWKVDRSLNLNANTELPSLHPATPESVLAVFHSLRELQQGPTVAAAERVAPIVVEQPTSTPVIDADPQEARVIVVEYDA
jgi:hypothetical protein